MTYNAWTKIDDGSEGAWQPYVWLGVVRSISRHVGERIYDKDSPIYEELEKNFPALTWRSEHSGSFRPYFRDFSKPWTITGVVSFSETFQLTEIGQQLAMGKIGPREFFASFCEHYSEAGELPFCILADGFLNAGKPLSLSDIFFGIETSYRPGIDDLASTLAIAKEKLESDIPSTAKRRLALMLSILDRTGAITKNKEGTLWFVWDGTLLAKLASRIGAETETTEARESIVGIDGAFMASAGISNLSLATSMPRNFIASLLAKPFLILTGLSGSGKSKLAHAFAAWIAETPQQYRIVAVGADWTSNENILGYQDALQTGRYCKPTNGALDLILAAATDTTRPYFLILDEMNLSHVERYFSDVLSAVESREAIALHSSEIELKCSPDDTVGVPKSIRFPPNLFVIGTVNVDETTYMFSPKVLDRANVIEFRATAGDIHAFLQKPKPVEITKLAAAGAKFGPAFVAAASSKDASLLSLSIDITGGADIVSELNFKLVRLFEALSVIGNEFGFRTAMEITRFTYFHAFLAGPGWKLKDALDAQVLQKLLPKLHGSERRLGPVLKMLNEFCEVNDCVNSKLKIIRMQERLKDGFTSFAEA
jgi:hypothetical protein